MTSIYDPASYPTGVENPYGPRVHAWPSRYHGPIYTRPEYRLQWSEHPLWRVEAGPAWNQSGLEGCAACAVGQGEAPTGPSATKIAIALGLTAAVIGATLWLGPKLVKAS